LIIPNADPKQGAPNHQFRGIQILRFIAAMLVVAMHLTQAISIYITGGGPDNHWKNGSVGVDIFFVISGFVMASSTNSAFGQGVRNRLESAWIFMKRRMVRIAPLYWFYTLVKAAVLLALPGLAMRSSVEPVHFAASLLFIPAVSPWQLIEPLLPVGWTLNFEMLFYVVFATAMAFGAPRIRFCVTIFLLIFLASQQLPNSTVLGYYAQTIVFEFILGVCIAHACTVWRRPGPFTGLLCVTVGAVLMFAIDWGPSADRLTTWGMGAALAVAGTIWLEPWIGPARVAGKLAFLGDASYSIYLSHTFVVPVGVLALRKAGLENALLIALCVAVSVIVAGCVSYLWIERPLSGFFKRLVFRKPTLVSFSSSGKSHAK
jgi:exopolysaccharide production protein ExoZ